MELWCEAAGMLHQLDRVAARYSVPVYSTGGFGSLTANYEIAERALSRDCATAILHVGDFDPSWESIFESIVEDAAAFVEADRTIRLSEVRGVRVALTAEQAGDHNLPTAPAKESDTRSKTWKGGTCQLEALAPDVLARLVEDAIVEQLDLELFEGQVELEKRERAELLALPSGGSTS
jgi:hypothetical protein